MKRVVDVVNKKFYDNSYSVFNRRADQMISTLMFGSNLVVLEKKDQRHCYAEKTYIWPLKLAQDCPARNHSQDVLDDIRANNPMYELCGDIILERDTTDGRSE